MTTTFASHVAAALDPAAFAPAVGFTPDPWQAELLRDTDHDWIALCSRQTGKSASAALAALWRASIVLEACRSSALPVLARRRRCSVGRADVRAHRPAGRRDLRERRSSHSRTGSGAQLAESVAGHGARLHPRSSSWSTRRPSAPTSSIGRSGRCSSFPARRCGY